VYASARLIMDCHVCSCSTLQMLISETFNSSPTCPVLTPASLSTWSRTRSTVSRAWMPLSSPILRNQYNIPGIFQQMLQYMTRLVEACTKSRGGHFEHSHKCPLSAVTCKLNVSGHMLIWTFFLVLVCGTNLKGLKMQ
jgi:hypothetical protein